MTSIGQRAPRFFRGGGSQSDRGAARLLIGVAAAVAMCVLAFPSTLGAQTTTPFGGGFDYDSGQPIEISSDSLEVQNELRMAIFRGTVRVRQGEVVMSANELRVTYAAEGGSSEDAIDRLEAIGNVVITNGKDTAGADRANYDIATGEVIMTGDVILTQCRSEIAGERLRINLAANTANMEGRTVVRIRSGENC